MVKTQGQPLTVYKASAGSGKTFTLAVEYMKRVIQDPAGYRHTLAVTFTNKATEEMKMRILSQLYGMWKGLPDSQTYLNRIATDLGMPPRMVAQQAGTALQLLLHNYHYFRVETIDTFFQRVLRNLARELDLTANLRIELNDTQVEEEAVDQLIEGLTPKDPVFRWIMEYVKENISDEKSWDVIRIIKKFGVHIFKDGYKQYSKEICRLMAQPDFFPTYTKLLRAMRQEALEQLQHYPTRFFDTLQQHGVKVEDFANGSRGVCSYFLKMERGVYETKELLTATVVAAMTTPNKWVKKKEQMPGNALYDLVVETLLPLLKATEEAREKWICQYKSADLTLRNLNQLRLLGHIEQEVRALNSEANRFLLSDTQTLLHALIQDSDSPFIFEKIGTQLRYLMIDEFQDTSTVQWQNFKVLLQECMSHEGAHNLIVGDVKQSIYRWRSGDWRLLNGIEREFGNHGTQVEVLSLTTNYRSQRNIIDFNNAFFKLAAERECQNLRTLLPEGAEEMQRAYDDVAQQTPKEEREGFVSVELMPKEVYAEEGMQRVVEIIDQLLAEGAKATDIAILVRSNATIQQLAAYCMEERPDLNLVSDEAFRLDSSQVVNTLVSCMRFLAHPENMLEAAFLEEQHLAADLLKERDRLLAMPLYELAEWLYGWLQQHFMAEETEGLTQEEAYLSLFFDRLAKYLADHTPYLDDFLQEWDNNLHRKTIQSGEVEGIRLITIHKSKGLEFDHVILPACDWTLEKAGTTLWCVPTTAPYDRLPLVPVSYSEKGMMGTVYEQDYLMEHLQQTVDNLNLLYVAFTRAAKSLYVLGQRGSRLLRSKLIEEVLPPLAQELGATLEGAVEMPTDTLLFCYGEQGAMREEVKKQTENVFSKQAVPCDLLPATEVCPALQFRQSNKSRDFVLEEDDMLKEEGLEDVAQAKAAEEQRQQTYIRTGKLLHYIFSTVRTTKDIPHALQELEAEGVIYGEGLSVTSLRSLLEKRLSHPKVQDWFSGRWETFNECAILHTDAQTGKVVKHRPDRVMTDGSTYVVVDFKFGRKRDAYQTQVQAYMQLLRAMGHKDVKGYLWYVYTNEIEEVVV